MLEQAERAAISEIAGGYGNVLKRAEIEAIVETCKRHFVPVEVAHVQESLLNPAHRVYFRAGLLVGREYMARFVEPESPTIAASIRANWWPALGDDPGKPRQLAFNELTVGEYGEQ